MKHLSLLTLVLLLACGDDGSMGSLELALAAEDTITDGLSPEGGDEAILDGWSVTFDEYVVAIGDVRLRYATDAALEASAPEILVVDLTTVPPAGLPAWSFPGLDAGRWEVFYRFASASEGTRHESVSEADFASMRDGGCTYLIRGSLDQPEGRSCPPASLATPPAGATPDADGCFANTSIAFDFCAAAETSLGPCESEDGPTGVAIPTRAAIM